MDHVLNKNLISSNFLKDDNNLLLKQINNDKKYIPVVRNILKKILYSLWINWSDTNNKTATALDNIIFIMSCDAILENKLSFKINLFNKM